jgi:hypothetical protein
MCFSPDALFDSHMWDSTKEKESLGKDRISNVSVMMSRVCGDSLILDPGYVNEQLI